MFRILRHRACFGAHSRLRVALPALCLAGAHTEALAGPMCIDSVETYRGLVIHQGASTEAVVAGDLPTGAIEAFDDLPVPGTDPFWDAFSIDRTLERIALTDPLLPDDPTEAEVDERVAAIADSFLATQTLDDQFLPDENGFRVTGGNGSVDLFDLVPVALFNRMDLMSEDGSTCGEHRIVYRDAGNSSALVIFEARVLNPHGSSRGAGGCLPLAHHWAQAGSMALPDPETGDIDSTELTSHMEDLFYDGVGVFPSAIHYDHLGGVVGQVRGNAISAWTSVWSLREWQLGSSLEDGLPELRAVSVKDNALAELLSQGVGASAPDTIGLEGKAWDIFQNQFLDHWAEDLVPNMLAPEAEGISAEVADGRDFIGAIRVGVLDDFNEFQSVSQPVEFLAADASGDVLDAVACWLEPAGPGCDIADPITGIDPGTTETHIVNRYVRAGTCAGCHLVSSQTAQRAVAPGILWPRAGSFVHVAGSSGNLSPALHGTFLPTRNEQLLDQFASASPGDINFDGIVNSSDLLEVLAHWGTADADADASCDGEVSTPDLIAVLAGWSPTPGLRMAGSESSLDSIVEALRSTETRRSLQTGLVMLREEQAALRDAEAALPGTNGRMRPPH